MCMAYYLFNTSHYSIREVIGGKWNYNDSSKCSVSNANYLTYKFMNISDLTTGRENEQVQGIHIKQPVGLVLLQPVHHTLDDDGRAKKGCEKY